MNEPTVSQDDNAEQTSSEGSLFIMGSDAPIRGFLPADRAAAHRRVVEAWTPYASDIWTAKVTVGE